LFPKANFADGLTIIEKLGHKKRIQVMRKAWIDEDRPKPAVEEVDDDFVAHDGEAMAVGEEGGRDVAMGDGENEHNTENGARKVRDEHDESQGIGQLRSSSPLILDDEELYEDMNGRIPAAKPSEAQEPDEDELDALLAEDTTTARPTISQAAAKQVPDQLDDFADDEEAMAMMDW